MSVTPQCRSCPLQMYGSDTTLLIQLPHAGHIGSTDCSVVRLDIVLRVVVRWKVGSILASKTSIKNMFMMDKAHVGNVRGNKVRKFFGRYSINAFRVVVECRI